MLRYDKDNFCCATFFYEHGQFVFEDFLKDLLEKI